MKKYLLAGLVFVLGMIFFPGTAKAQYNSPYVYNGNAYLARALASRRASHLRHAARKSRKRVSSNRRSAHRHNRRSALIENSIKPELLMLDLPKRTLIV